MKADRLVRFSKVSDKEVIQHLLKMLRSSPEFASEFFAEALVRYFWRGFLTGSAITGLVIWMVSYI